MLHRLSRPLLVVGSVAIVFGMRQVHNASRGPVEGLMTFIVFGLVAAVAAIVLGLPYVPPHAMSALVSAVAAVVVAGLTWAGLLLVFPGSFPRFVLLASLAAMVPWFVLCWWLAERGHRVLREEVRVIAIADADELETLRADEARAVPADEMGYALVATLDVAALDATALRAAIDQSGATMVILGISAQYADHVLDLVEPYHRNGVRVRTLEQFYERWLGKLPVSSLERSALLTDVSTIHEQWFGRMKRLADIVLALGGMVALGVVLPFVAIGNLVANRGPLFFTQERTGLAGAPFTIHKFRTMKPDESGEYAWTSENDPRITPFGSILRRTHLDELPQVWDILRGVLSTVGPRPEQPRYVQQLEAVLPYYSSRHVVKPGLTGWAQVKFGYSASEFDAREKLQYDLYYVRHQSVVLDLKIVKRTITQVLFARGR